MGTFLEMVPSDVKDQIKEITKSSGLDYNDESIEIMAEAWVEKKNIFEEKIKEFGMVETDLMEKDDERGALLMTFSGSLLNLNPKFDGKRGSEYTSIGLRGDVPDSASHDDVILVDDVQLNEILEFERGPVSSTSQIFKIAVVSDDCTPEEEQEKLNNATMVIADEFVDVNKTIIQRD